MRRWTLRVCSVCDKPLHGPGGCAGGHEQAASAVAVEVAPAEDLACRAALLAVRNLLDSDPLLAALGPRLLTLRTIVNAGLNEPGGTKP